MSSAQLCKMRDARVMRATRKPMTISYCQRNRLYVPYFPKRRGNRSVGIGRKKNDVDRVEN